MNFNVKFNYFKVAGKQHMKEIQSSKTHEHKEKVPNLFPRAIHNVILVIPTQRSMLRQQ